MKNIEKELNDTELKMYEFITNQKPNYIYNIESNVGVGKIQMLKNIAEKMNVKFIEFRMSLLDISEFMFFDKSLVDKYINEPTLIVFNEIDRTPTNVLDLIHDIIIDRKTPNGLNINSDIYFVCCSELDIKIDSYIFNRGGIDSMKTLRILNKVVKLNKNSDISDIINRLKLIQRFDLDNYRAGNFGIDTERSNNENGNYIDSCDIDTIIQELNQMLINKY